MRYFDALSGQDVARLHGAVLEILDEVGVKVESPAVLDRLAAMGGCVDPGKGVVTFAPAWVEQFLAGLPKVDWGALRPQVGVDVGIYTGYYLDPRDEAFKPWTEQRIGEYVKLARHLIPSAPCHTQNCVFPGVPSVGCLEARIMAWKWGFTATGSLADPRLFAALLEMCEAVAAERGGRPQDHYRGYVHLRSPLMFGSHEAEEFDFFVSRGYRMGLGVMGSLGASVPVTLPGAVALQAAEQIFTAAVQHAYGAREELWLGCSIDPLDMRTATFAYGRPEGAAANAMMAQLARHYGARHAGHSGVTNAKTPGAQAAAEKALTVVGALLSGGSGRINCGMLANDEVHSPVQMVLDAEFASALRHFVRAREIDDRSLALDAIRRVGHGGLFTGDEHTVAAFRAEQWEPSVWLRGPMQRWLASGRKRAIDHARDKALDALSSPDIEPQLSDATERALRRILHTATG